MASPAKDAFPKRAAVGAVPPAMNAFAGPQTPQRAFAVSSFLEHAAGHFHDGGRHQVGINILTVREAESVTLNYRSEKVVLRVR